MAISLRPQNLARYRDLARLLIKYGRSDLVKQAGLDEVVEAGANGSAPEVSAKADELTDDLERLGPTYIKLGQLLSTRGDLIPPAYAEALSRLQDRVEPISYEEVEEVISSQLGF